jgi:hypothetical protein
MLLGLLHLSFALGGRRVPRGSTILLSSVTSLATVGQVVCVDRVIAEVPQLLGGARRLHGGGPILPVLWGEM